jgi:hypothetical protein
MRGIPKAMILQFSPEVARKLGELSEAHGVPVTELVSRAVERQLPEWEAGNFIPAPVNPAANESSRCEPLCPDRP